MDEYIELTKLEHCTVNYDRARTDAKHPNITLPGVGYDMFLEDGSRYYGTWELSNYLNFRLEDHTKLVWASEKTLPYPDFRWYDDRNVERYDPLQDLALELHEGEFANYTVREVKQDCTVILEGVGDAEVDVYCNGMLVGVVTLVKGDILKPHWSRPLTIHAAEEATVKVVVKSGVLTLKNVKFEY